MPASVVIAGQKPRSKLDYLFGGVAEGMEQRREAQVLQDILGTGQPGQPGQVPAQSGGLNVPGITGGQFEVPGSGAGAAVPMPPALQQKLDPIAEAAQMSPERIFADRQNNLNQLKNKSNRIMLDPRLSPEQKQRALQLVQFQYEAEAKKLSLQESIVENKALSVDEKRKQAIVSTALSEISPDENPNNVLKILVEEGLNYKDAVSVSSNWRKNAEGKNAIISLKAQADTVSSRVQQKIRDIEKQNSIQDAFGNITFDLTGEAGKKALKEIQELRNLEAKSIKRLYERYGIPVPGDIRTQLTEAREQDKRIQNQQDAELDQIFGGE